MAAYTMDHLLVTFLSPDRIFYACVLSQLSVIPDKHMETMGVCYSKAGRLSLYYNPEFIKEHSLRANIMFIEHELLHLVWRHLYRFKITEYNKRFAKLINVGLDIAINQHITGMQQCPECAQFCYPETYNFPRNMTGDWYIEELKKMAKENPSMSFDTGKGSGNHEKWGDMVDPETGEVKDAKSVGIDTEFQEEEMVRKVFEMAKERGCIPSFMEKEVKDFLAEDRHDWRRTLRIFVNSVLTVNKRQSQKRVNRRFSTLAYILPGKKKIKKPDVLIVRDTSGSVFNDKTQEDFQNEMMAIQKRCGTVWVADCDTEIKSHYKVKSKKDFKMYKGGGGTCFEPAFELAKKLGVDGIIYLTDTEGSFPKVEDIGKFRTHTVWVTLNLPDPKLPFGKHVNIEE